MPVSEMTIEGSASARRKSGKIVPARPEPRAPAVLEYLEAGKQARARLELEIAELALAAIEGKPGGKEKLAALHEQISAATFEIDCNAKAHELALRIDKEAVTTWRAAVLALPPEQLIAGITAKTCCTLCDVNLCVISGNGRCLHPRDSNIPAALTGDSRLRKAHHMAAEKLMAEKRRNERV